MPQDKKQSSNIIDPFKRDVPSGIIDPFRQRKPEEIVAEGIKSGIQKIVQLPGAQQTISTISPALDFISRPGYASARFADSLADDSKSVLDAVSDSLTELLAGNYPIVGDILGGTKARKQISYSDVIKRRFPEYALKSPEATILLGFVGDVLLDPTTYLGIGLVKNGITVGSKVLTKTTKEVLEEGLKTASKKIFVGKNGTLELIEDLAKATKQAEKVEGVLDRRLARAAAKGEDVTEALIPPNAARRLHKKLDIENQLKEQGYFDAVRAKQDEIESFMNDLLGSKDVDIAETIAKSETLDDLKRVARNRLPNEMFVDEVRERFNNRISYLAKLDAKNAEKFFEPKGVYLKYGLPFGKQKDLVRLIGLEGVSNRVKQLTSLIEANKFFSPAVKGARQLGETFSRNFGLPDEYIKFRDELENELGYLTDEMTRNTRKLFKNFKKEEREKIGEAMHWMDGETRKLEDIRSQSSEDFFRTLTDGEAAQIAQQGMERFNLSPEARSLVAQMQQSYKEAGLLEMRAGLLRSNLLNYSPRGYEIIENADDMSLITRGKYGSAIPQPYLASSHQRKFLTKEEAEAAGLVPELDAAILYANRMLSSQRALAIQHFKDSVTELFGAYNPKSRIAHTGILPTTVLGRNIPERVVTDMKMIGEAVYPSGINPVLRRYIRGFDKLQSYFKRGATTVKPSFAAKQLISNTFQAAMFTGLKAFKALDPRVAADAAILMMRKGRPLNSLPPFLTNFISRHFTGNEGLDAILAGRSILSRHFGEEVVNDIAAQFKLRNALGQEYSGTELLELARENGIFRGFDATGESFTRKISNEITKEQNTYKNVVGVLGKVFNHASMVEDYGRMMMFLNGIRLGYTAKDSAKLVNKALFDYSRGLSDIERTWFRRIIPFYSFQRFAIPAVLKNTLAKPGNFATTEKLMRTMEKLLVTGEELNEGEVHIFNEKGNNFLLEQPRLLTGFDNSGRATLSLLNNLTPYDVLNLQVYDKDGDLDIERTAEKGVLAALTPFLKVPLEALINRDFFTGKTIDQAAKFGNIEGSIGKIIPQSLKELMGWETATNKLTGKTTTYVNPFLSYYTMQFIPALRDVVKSQEDQEYDSLMGPAEAAMRIILESSNPVKSKDVDIKEMGIRSLLRRDKDLEEIKASMIRAKIEGRDSEFEKHKQDVLRYAKILSENQKIRSQFDIRGLGLKQNIIPGVKPEVPEQPTQQQDFK